MRLVTRAVTAAGVAVLGITVMGGPVHADSAGTSGLLPGLSDTVTNTTNVVHGVVGSVSNVTTPQRKTQRTSRSPRKRAPGVNVGLKVGTPVLPVRAAAGASVHAAPETGVAVRAALDVCLGGTAGCGNDLPPSPPGPPLPPGNPTTPPTPSEPPAPTLPPSAPPVASGELGEPVPSAMASRIGSLPFTGAPVNTLIGLAGVLLVAGAVALAASRRRAGSES
jgi:hypothetical protein